MAASSPPKPLEYDGRSLDGDEDADGAVTLPLNLGEGVAERVSGNDTKPAATSTP